MKFIINTTNLKTGGALQVASSLIVAWNQHCPQHEFHICLSPQLVKQFTNIPLNKHILIYPFEHKGPTSLIDFIRNRQQLRSIEAKIKPDGVLSVFGPAFWTPKAPHLVGFANGYYLFDDSDYIKAKLKSNLLARFRYYSRRFLMLLQLKKEALQYWVETVYAQERLSTAMSIALDKIQIIGNCATISEHSISPKNNNTFRLLYVSAFYEHKNFSIIPAVIDELEKRGLDCQFWVTLPDAEFQSIFGHPNNSKYLFNLGPIRTMEIGQAYANADAVFMPSLLETFSANYPEAMLMNKPLLCADLAFARSICQDAALYFNPFDADDIADKIQELIQNNEMQARLVAAGNRLVTQMETPESRAKKIVQQLMQMVNNDDKIDSSCVA